MNQCANPVLKALFCGGGVGDNIRSVGVDGVSEAMVAKWNEETGYLDVVTSTERLIRFGDTIYDSAGTAIDIPSSKIPSNELMFTEFNGARSTHASFLEPDYTVANPGDIWWSGNTGKLYIYFDDGDSQQWVTTQPSGSLAFVEYGADVPVGETSTTTQSFATPQADTTISMSTMGPSSRADGSANRAGDLWWSTQTGILYIWVVENPNEFESDRLPYSEQWVATDPSAAILGGDQIGISSQLNNTPTDVTVYTQGVNVLVAEASPTTMSDGGALVPGTLWWSPASGKMYIYYTDADSSQWVVTNPTSNQSGPDSLDQLITNDGSGPDYVSLWPVAINQDVIWVAPTEYDTDWKVGDILTVHYGAPEDGSRDSVRIGSILEPFKFKVQRSTSPIQLQHGATVTNATRSYLQIETTTPHELIKGDGITVSGAVAASVNGAATVTQTGDCVPATFSATISGGQVSGVTIDTPGSGYTGNFYLNFVGGGGFGAEVVVIVDASGDTVTTSINSGGSGYTSIPTIEHTPPLTPYQFLVEVPGTNIGEETNLTYTTTSPYASGTPNEIEMLSNGFNYMKLPKVVGLIRSQRKRAKGEANLNGTSISNIIMTFEGYDYTNPIVVIEDITGSGSGAVATANINEFGSITSVDVVSSGENYVEPVIHFVEDSGTYLALTEDIGRIASCVVTEVGAPFHTDKVATPELHNSVRMVVSFPGDNFVEGEEVWQGTSTNKLATGTVVEYDSFNSTLVLERVIGNLSPDEVLVGDSGNTAIIYNLKQADINLDVSALAKNVGRFVNEVGNPSTKASYIQDSFYYQHFSYVISSPMSLSTYESMVRKNTHPSGMNLFSELRIEDTLDALSSAEEVLIG